MQLHAYAASTDPEIQAATRAVFGELRVSIERLPPAQVQQWFGTGLLMTAATAMNLQTAGPGSRRQACPAGEEG